MITTATAEDLERIDRAVLGKTEHPKNSNHIFVWAQLQKWGLCGPMQGQPYCAGGIEWTDHKAKAPKLPISSPFYCPSRVQYARAHGLLDTSGHYDKGDEVFFAWTPAAIAAGLAEHVGRVIADNGKAITTIEFNTSSSNSGSQANGDGVFLKSRPHGSYVLGALKYSKLLADAAHGGKVPHNPTRRNPWAKALRAAQLPIHHGDRGDAVRAVQWAVGVPVDGVFGEHTLAGVMHFQRFHTDRNHRGLLQDGVVGPLTLWALLRITHFKH